jgi:mono/diheme cytochrome c family protein
MESAPAATEAAPAMNLPEGVTAAMVAEGQTIFMGQGICFTCHMQGGVGGPLAPNLTDDTWINIDGSYDAIVQTVMTGVAEPKEHPSPMLPRAGTGITDEQVRAVAAYVWTLSHGS